MFINQPVRYGPAKILVDPIHVSILSFILLILIHFNILLGSATGGNDLAQPKPVQPCNRAIKAGMGWGDHHPMCVVTSDSTNQTKSIRCRHMPSHASCFASENFPKSSASPAPSDAILEKNHGSNDRSPAVKVGPHLLHPHLPGVPRLQHLRRSLAHQQILTAPGRSMGANVGKRTKRSSKIREDDHK